MRWARPRPRQGHSAGVLSAKGTSRTAGALQFIKANLEPTLEQQGLLGLRTGHSREVRDVLLLRDGFEERFHGFQAHQWSQAQALEQLGPELPKAFKRLAVAMLLCATACEKHASSLVLAAVQITSMSARSVRGAHFDNPRHGDLVLSLTITGTGTVTLGRCSSTRQRQSTTREQSGTWYALSGTGLSDYTHAVRTCDEPRLSVTYRYVKRRP